MQIDVRLRTIRSSGNDEIDLPRAGVTCIVGGNNVGKSQALRDILAQITHVNATSVVITEIRLDKPDISEQLAADFLDKVASKVRGQSGAPQVYAPVNGGQNLNLRDFIAHYGPSDRVALQAAHQFFCWHASAGSLVNFASGGIGNVGVGHVTHPLGLLFRDGERERELSSLAEEAFTEPLTLDRITGDVRLRMGAVRVEVPKMDNPTLEYANAVEQLPTLESQGDGIKSFIGLALAVVASSAQILLVDEPEAFLHPAQARALGRWLSTAAAKRDIQVVLATHDRDLLLGLLDGGEGAVVNIVRLTRRQGQNFFHHLPPELVAAVWSDPVLRYSNILQGLFHEQVAICEADADCRFYGAVMDQLGVDENRRARADGTLLVPSGGKQRVATMAKALARLGVSTRGIVDFDIMKSRSDVRALVEAGGYEWTNQMDADYVIVSQSINKAEAWDIVKKQGEEGVPPGAPYVACQRLLSCLSDRGVHVVRVGELEDFDKEIGLDGAAWVSAMLEKGGHRTSEKARSLLRGVLG